MNTTVLIGDVGDEQEHVDRQRLPLAMGTRVTSLERNRTGVIEGLCEYMPGSYLVIPDEPNAFEAAHKSKWICTFDQVEIVGEVAA